MESTAPGNLFFSRFSVRLLERHIYKPGWKTCIFEIIYRATPSAAGPLYSAFLRKQLRHKSNEELKLQSWRCYFETSFLLFVILGIDMLILLVFLFGLVHCSFSTAVCFSAFLKLDFVRIFYFSVSKNHFNTSGAHPSQHIMFFFLLGCLLESSVLLFASF